MEKIANKAFNQFEENVYNLEKISNIHKEQKEEIIELYKKVERLKNHMIMLDEYGKQVLIFTLSVKGNTLYDELTKNCIYKVS